MAMASRSTEETQTSIQTETTSEKQEESTVVLTLKKPQTSKKVGWSQDTVDNEHLGRKKSKCCCVYKKPHKFGESSSESEEDECDHCSGHVEHKNSKEAT
ncbi:E3 ubiquitin-protein ligase PPP1R11-like [Daphnia pulicaria]|uniref:E3 ubiquitin-protein ligase PPP1R11-like n=1 Tax=Daphnia pulicaria TaxID=35523 RepID=UPI001EEABAF5|nr:E3 ubiquitin-protein ligase PPP1R11-like [Daphnia pulicaria]XP_046642309.1 E3 ubiquitin-protein ligase PPP1R11-like [Daphnia pulicaria]